MGISTLRSLLVAAIFLSNCVTWTASRHHYTHNVNGHRSRHRRQGAGLFLPASFVIPGGQGYGAWGEWGEISPCSRTCGGGVASQKRICLEVGPDGQPLCQGGDTKYFSCQTQDCPEGAGDFRSEQCAEYDTETFRGNRYNWVPYTKAPNPCELNCMPRGERFYYRQKLKVVDGTRCNDESFDVCVDGVCQPVGCDMMLGSNAREDKCRACRGNGTNCHTNAGLIDSQDLRKGYNDILLIPQGATNIFIEEIRQSNNYLALRAKQDNVYYLNGEYHIDFPRSLLIAGSLWHYERSQQGFAAPDKLRCLGPTTEALYLSLLLQDDNVGIKYEYSVPSSLAPPPNQQYNWVHEEFSQCSATCGGGFQTRQVSCRSREELEVVDESLCDAGLKPAVNQSCNVEACAPRWVEGPWSPCSKPCGEGGTRSREVHCEKIITNGFPSIVADKECFDLLGPKPELYQECNQNASCPTWFTGPWKPCDKLCGEGKQKRQVVCHQRVGGRVELFDDEECAEEKPATEQPCLLHPCDGVDWVLSDWAGCDTCLSTVRTRVAHCATKDHKLVDPALCAYHPAPVLEEPCDRTKLPACQVQWYATQWSNCSVECGKGVKTRRVFCGLFDGASVMKVDDDRCDKDAKYNDTAECEVPKDKCPAKWFAGPWSECTKACGGGEQFRRVMCLSGNESVLQCDEDSILESTQSCNIGPCDKDEMLPLDAKSTPIMDEYDDEECVDEDEYPEANAEELIPKMISPLFDDYTFSDAPYSPEGSGTGSTSFTEIESEFTSESGSGYEPGITETTEVSGSGSTELFETTESTVESTGSTEISETVSTEETISTETDATSETGSTVSAESESATSETSTELTESTVESSPTTEIADTETSPSGSTEETESTEKSTTEISTLETESTVSGSTDSTVTDIESTTSETGSTETTVTGSTETDTTEITETGSTETTETGSTETAETGSTETTETGSTETTETGSTETTETGSTEPTETGSTETTETGSTDTTESSSTEPTETQTTESVEATESTTSASTEESTTSGSSETTISEGLTTESSASTTESVSEETDSSTETGTTDSELSTTESDSSATTETSESTEPSVSTTESETGETTVTETETESGSTETTETGSTETTESSISTETTESGATESTESSSIGSTETTEFETTGSSTTEETGSTESTSEGSSTAETSVTEESTISAATTPWDWTSTVEVYTNKPQCKRRKKVAKCTRSKFGCCPDKITAAAGPFDEGCPNPKTCKESKFGCCPDGVSPASGFQGKGCPQEHCNETLYGCCKSDGITPAEGNDDEGCPPPPPACKATKHGCCKDQKTAAKGPEKQGCPETEPKKATEEPTLGCASTEFGCCYDNETDASGPNGEGCPCSITEFGCCPDGVTTALGNRMEGCLMSCNTSAYGCCPDGETPAHGPEFEGCCLQYAYGCCPDNYKPAEGPHLEGCGCQYAHFGCCPDNISIARGPRNEGCGCQYSRFGCCPDRHTEAQGPDYEGCGCHTYQFGCCPDGVTVSTGPNLQGCLCQQSEYGCCGDQTTPAKGPDMEGCDCSSSKYGCCPDGVTEAKGEKFLNCTDVPENRQAACALTNDRGSCRNYSVYWYYDMTYGGCSRFWYGGCEGNGNRFVSQEECKAVCEQPSPKDACKLPKVKGACSGYHVRWYYDSNREQCSQFVFGGCLGNANNFDSRELCQERCEPEKTEDQCNLSIERGPCAGNFLRWGYNWEKRRCERFVWGGCGGNTNRFGSEAACLQRCNPPGAPDKACSLPQEAGNCSEKHALWAFSASENRCVPFYYSGCGGNDNRYDSEQACASSCPSAYVQETCTLPALTGECADYTQRWFFDTTNRRCRQFYYGGCGGNENNFATERECEARCSEQPPASSTPAPAPRPRPAPPTAQPDPDRSDFCFLEVDSGPCTTMVSRWAYDAALGECAPFQYGGCGGNRNNFPSQEYCQYYCAPAQDVCQLPMLSGPCDQSLMRWFYDAASDSCSQFAYGGCEGNGNRFNSLQECEQQCRTGPASAAVTTTTTTTIAPQFIPSECQVTSTLEECDEEGEVWYLDVSAHACVPHVNADAGVVCRRTGVHPSQEACERACGAFRDLDVCRYPVDPGPCNEAVPKVYYNSVSGSCEQFAYGGCHGGPNRFSSIEECEQVCRPNIDPCSQPPEPGNCLAYLYAWYYDVARDACGQFVYGGCNGNDNRFETQEECENRCKKSASTTTAVIPSSTTTTTTTTTTSAPVTTPQLLVEAECQTPSSVEPCGANETVYYYDARVQACLVGEFGACRHPNSYRTEEECERRCGAFRGQDVCGSALDPGPCLSAIPKVYWDAASGRCLDFTYGGCGGGPNRFSSADECQEVCGSTGPEAACLQAVATGDGGCGAPARRWFYSTARGDCLPFVYAGCGGNDNNFHSYEECGLRCMAPEPEEPELEGGNEVLPDCDLYNAECAALRCEYGVQRTRTAGGCERCACVPVDVDCAKLRLECDSLKCTYGVDKTTGDDGCERCRCTEHPCARAACPAGQRCVATAYRDAITLEAKYSSECRIANKSGSCPSEAVVSVATEGHCRRECNDDADCVGVGKCCTRGCSQLCLPPAAAASPASPASPAAPTAPATHLTTYAPELPQAPQANVETEPEVVASEGGMATLRCLFHGNPPPKITWRRGEITIDGDLGRYRLLSDGALEIVSLYRNDSGVYICVADNGLGVATQEVRLEVQDPVSGPAGIAGTPDAVVRGQLGQSLSVRCMAFGYPQPAIYWYRGRNGPMVPYSSSLYEARGNVLQIRKLTLETLGEYICQAYNGIGKPADWAFAVQTSRPDDTEDYDYPFLSARAGGAGGAGGHTAREPLTAATAAPAPAIEIPVYTVPVSTRLVAERTRVPAGAQINLPCDVDGYPVPDVHWTRDGERLAASDRITLTEARLTVSRASTNDSGVYGCHAANPYSSHYSTVHITVDGLYIPPTCKDNPYFANCHLIVQSKFCHHKYYSGFCCKSCVEAGQLDPAELDMQADAAWYRRK